MTVLDFLSKLLAIVVGIDSASVAFLSSAELATMVFSITRNRGYFTNGGRRTTSKWSAACPKKATKPLKSYTSFLGNVENHGLSSSENRCS